LPLRPPSEKECCKIKVEIKKGDEERIKQNLGTKSTECGQLFVEKLEIKRKILAPNLEGQKNLLYGRKWPKIIDNF
jgi:hypothetical protein